MRRALVLALVLGISPAMAQAQAETGAPGDPGSWMSDEFKADWGLAAIKAQYAYARGLTGKGIRLGVFDSGVDLAHGEFAGRNVDGIRIADVLADGTPCTNTSLLAGPDACFLSDGDTVAVDYFHYTDADRALVDALVDGGYLYDWVPEYFESLAGFSFQTHGTHVAGTMAANRDGQGTHGVAFAADLTSARLFSNSYSDLYSQLGLGGESHAIGPDSGTVESMYAQMAAAGVRAINHSWGLSEEPTSVADMDMLYAYNVAYFDTYVQPSLRDGMLQVFAAGNNYGEIAGIYATLPRYVPDLEKYWLSVVNIDLAGAIDGSSSRCGQTMDWCVSAPGTDITSTVVVGDIEGEVLGDGNGGVAGLEITAESPEYGYGDMTGTSMAAPHVSGALALLMERFPYLDNPQIRDVLLTTATDLGAPGVDEVYGWGLINLEKAIDGPGMLRVDTDVVMNQRAGGTRVWEGAAWDDWRNDIDGPGRLGKDGIGWLRLSGDNRFAGASVRQGILELTGDNTLAGDVSVDGTAAALYLTATGSLNGSDLRVNQGMAVVNGSVRDGRTVVGAGGTLGGSGTLGDLEVQGTLAPGNSIGTLSIKGDYVQKAGSTYVAELSPPAASDTLDVSGTALIEGGTLMLLPSGDGTFLLGQQYTLLTAAGGLSGAFEAVDASGLSPFLKPSALFSANRLQLAIERGQALASAATTRNQKPVATALDSMADSSGLLQRLVLLSAPQAATAFDQLSGEIHASAKSLLAQDSRAVRDSALARARHGQDAFSAQNAADPGLGAWVEVEQSNSRLEGDGNATQARLSGNTTLVGADLQTDSGWRFGLLGGTGRSTLRVAGRSSKAEVDSRHVGAHAGRQWGGFGLRAGYAQSRQTLETHREVVFTGLSERADAKYDADLKQAFVEAGYRFAFGRNELEPFAQFAQVRIRTDDARETGGLSALAVRGDSSTTHLSTAGLRFNANLSATGQPQSWLSLRASLAYRHAGGDLTPRTSADWNGGGGFTVEGTPLTRNATLAELGVAARLSARTLLELGYTGMLASDGNDTGMNARLSVQF
ncbi:autotransporter domain-containing protein [Stenotrophomonas mori]|uniref:autotransporter domain-containing protein n=1 Tax=Stenotrophomonas mori TaxID=2871096 RepID=UPI0020217DBA|nr:autotransporter serine protease [Stenotrophomonas mori]